MTLLRSAAAAAAGPCSLGLFIRRLSSSSSFSTRRRPPTYACPYKYTHTYAAASPSSSPWLLSRRRGFSASASSASGPGPIDSPMMQTMENKIKEQLEAEMVIVRDAYGDGRHVCIDVVSKAFEGKSPVNRQRMVYKAIWEELQTTVHAVDQMTTKTPAEAAADN